MVNGMPVVLLASAVIASATPPPTTKPNVVVFMVDDMGWVDWEGTAQGSLNSPHGQVHGGNATELGSIFYETPNMRRLAREGITFNNAYAASSLCSPSRVTFLTGRSPARTRTTDYINAGTPNAKGMGLAPPPWNQDGLRHRHVTLPETLRAHGWDTYIAGKWHAGGGGDPSKHGFDQVIGMVGGGYSGSAPTSLNPYNRNGRPYFGPWGEAGVMDYGNNDFYTDMLINETLSAGHGQDQSILNSIRADRPFFLFFSLHAVHGLVNCKGKYKRHFVHKKSGSHSDSQHAAYPVYAGLLKSADDALGRLLDLLSDPDGDPDTNDSVRDNTLIICVSDNGGETLHTSNKPLRAGKGTLYEGGVRVPMIVSWTGHPRVKKGAITTAQTTTADLYTTILSATGTGGADPSAEGVDILPALEGQPFQRGSLFWHFPHYRFEAENSFVSAVRKGPWKLLYHYGSRKYSLYNTDNDIREKYSLVSERPALVHELSQVLRRWLVNVGAQMPLHYTRNTTTGHWMVGESVPLPHYVLPHQHKLKHET